MFTLSKSDYFVCELLAFSLEVGAMPSSSFQSALQRQIYFPRFLDSLPATLRYLWNSSIFFNKFSFEEHVLILKSFSWVEMGFPLGGGGGGGYSWEFAEGVCRPVLQILIFMGLFLIQLEPIDNMFIHHRRSLESYARFQTKMGKVYTRIDQNDSKSIPFGAAHTDIMAYIREYTTG